MSAYPIDEAIPALLEAFKQHRSVVLHAPPGAGKTTRVPLALEGRIVMLEPRRLAATNAARWMARSLGEPVGHSVGYTIRFERKVSPQTRIELVTEGILTRRMQGDPALEGVSYVIFDEFHERGLNTDLALALCLDIQRSLRDDLRILVMSATLDCEPIARLLNAPVVASEGRAYPVEERYLTSRTDGPLAPRVADAVRVALRETSGDMLVFMPGAGEIKAVARELSGLADIAVHQLYGDMPFEAQQRAIMPSERRRVVLATNIAETSLTIEGVSVVIDSGLERRMRYDPSSGLSRLVTMTISRASATQRQGRAGRLGPGVCYRLYGRHIFEGMVRHTPPEITSADLCGLVLELAAWGVRDACGLLWIDPPPQGAWDAARSLLVELGAIDHDGKLTAAGKSMARLPLHPRLSRMLIRAQELGVVGLGADLAALLGERVRGELLSLLDALKDDSMRNVRRVSAQIRQLMDAPPAQGDYDIEDVGRLLLDAYPDRIGQARGEGRFLLSGGSGVKLPVTSALADAAYIVAVNLDAGGAADGVVHMAVAVDEALIRAELSGRIAKPRTVQCRDGRVSAFIKESIGAIALSSVRIKPSEEELSAALIEAVRADRNLIKFSATARQLQCRVALIRRHFDGWPDISDEALFAEPSAWLTGVRDISEIEMHAVLNGMLPWTRRAELEKLAPAHVTVPTGRSVEVDYCAGQQPVVSVKLQEMFGLTDTPTVAGGRVRIMLHLLSPARRPIAVTSDLKGFWGAGYVLVKKDLKGRYPKHPWPDDPTTATPTAKTKRKS